MSADRKPEVFKEGRRCTECNAKLSIYNPRKVCSPCYQRIHGVGPQPPLSAARMHKRHREGPSIERPPLI